MILIDAYRIVYQSFKGVIILKTRCGASRDNSKIEYNAGWLAQYWGYFIFTVCPTIAEMVFIKTNSAIA